MSSGCNPTPEEYGKMVYDHLMPRVVTTFHVPAVPDDDIDSVTKGDVFEVVRMMPFTCIRIVPPVSNEVVSGIHYTVGREWIIQANPDNDNRFNCLWAIKARIRIGDRMTVSYSPDEDNGESFPVSVLSHLLNILRDGQSRFIEKKVSRQVRRAEGILTPDYHEYIIVKRRDVKPGDDANRWSDIARRYPYLHAVRAHLRRMECGRLVQVRAHTRGKGTLFQVKDYKVGAVGVV